MEHYQNIKHLWQQIRKSCQYVYFITDIYTNDIAHNSDYQQLIEMYQEVDVLNLFIESSQRDSSKLFTYQITKPEEMFLS
jgi:hypothetical protein